MRQRQYRIQVRLNNDEHLKFTERVQKTGLSKEAYLRLIISNKAPRERAQNDGKILKELYAIGNNLNQIARKANALSLMEVERYDENVDFFKSIMKDFLNK